MTSCWVILSRQSRYVGLGIRAGLKSMAEVEGMKTFTDVLLVGETGKGQTLQLSSAHRIERRLHRVQQS